MSAHAGQKDTGSVASRMSPSLSMDTAVGQRRPPPIPDHDDQASSILQLVLAGLPYPYARAPHAPHATDPLSESSKQQKTARAETVSKRPRQAAPRSARQAAAAGDDDDDDDGDAAAGGAAPAAPADAPSAASAPSGPRSKKRSKTTDSTDPPGASGMEGLSRPLVNKHLHVGNGEIQSPVGGAPQFSRDSHEVPSTRTLPRDYDNASIPAPSIAAVDPPFRTIADDPQVSGAGDRSEPNIGGANSSARATMGEDRLSQGADDDHNMPDADPGVPGDGPDHMDIDAGAGAGDRGGDANGDGGGGGGGGDAGPDGTGANGNGNAAGGGGGGGGDDDDDDDDDDSEYDDNYHPEGRRRIPPRTIFEDYTPRTVAPIDEDVVSLSLGQARQLADVCAICGWATGFMVTCSGRCQRQFHPLCAGWTYSENEAFLCEMCKAAASPACSDCGKVFGPEETPIACTITGCNVKLCETCHATMSKEIDQSAYAPPDEFVCKRHFCVLCHESTRLRPSLRCFLCAQEIHVSCLRRPKLLENGSFVCDAHDVVDQVDRVFSRTSDGTNDRPADFNHKVGNVPGGAVVSNTVAALCRTLSDAERAGHEATRNDSSSDSPYVWAGQVSLGLMVLSTCRARLISHWGPARESILPPALISFKHATEYTVLDTLPRDRTLLLFEPTHHPVPELFNDIIQHLTASNWAGVAEFAQSTLYLVPRIGALTASCFDMPANALFGVLVHGKPSKTARYEITVEGDGDGDGDGEGEATA